MTAPQDDAFWTWFGKAITICCYLFTMACAIGFVVVLVRDYQDAATKPWAVVAPDSTHLHPKVKP